MEMNDEQRAELARRIEGARLRQFRGNRKAAYTAANVNSNTWTRAEAGDPIAERSVVAIVGTLWPETGGDWRSLDPPLTGSPGFAAEVESSNLSPSTKAWILERLADETPSPPTEPRKGVEGA